MNTTPAPQTTTTPPKPEPSTHGWLCPNHPFGHRFHTPPFPNNRTRCGNCGASPTE
ncbi:hypothetical protein ACH4UR_35840 [Streptomyces lydicus]|uniref:hypothetical protein n=1 Tax=Streptomyces lydicus TaxID=47763 RepID=UPI0033EC1B6B